MYESETRLTIGLKETGHEEFSLQEKHSFSGLETQDQNLKMYLEAPVTKVSDIVADSYNI